MKKSNSIRKRNKRINRAFFARRKGFKKWLDRHPDAQRLVRRCIESANRLAYADDPLYAQKHGWDDWMTLHVLTQSIGNLANISSYEVLDYCCKQAHTTPEQVHARKLPDFD